MPLRLRDHAQRGPRGVRNTINIDIPKLLAAVADVLDPGAKKVIYKTTCRTAGVGREFAAKGNDALRQFAASCGVDFREAILRDYVRR